MKTIHVLCALALNAIAVSALAATPNHSGKNMCAMACHNSGGKSPHPSIMKQDTKQILTALAQSKGPINKMSKI